MRNINPDLKSILAAALVGVWFSIPVGAETAALQPMYDRLAAAGPDEAAAIVREIGLERLRSGSVAMDLLLKRGLDALERGEPAVAAEHLTALLDHAPDFAEGWHARAKAWFALDELGLAVADLEQALRLDPRHYEAMFGLGAILEQIGRFAAAQEAYALALKAHPHYVEAQEAVTRLEAKTQGQSL